MAVDNPPRVRTFRARHNATTWTLVEDVTLAARAFAKYCTWPHGLDRELAPELAHAFAASQVQYVADMDQQDIRMPWHAVGQTGDCKSTAVLIAGICAAAGHRVVLRFLQYHRGPTHWAHVFAVVDGVPVDPLLPFGQQFPYFRKHETPIT